MPPVNDVRIRQSLEAALLAQRSSISTEGSSDEALVRWLVKTLRPAADEKYLGVLGEYAIIKVIARGGMGVVLEAKSLAHGSEAAIKLIRPHLIEDKVTRERFVREARAVTQVDHPSVIKMNMETDGNVHFLVMPLLHGETLRDRLESKVPIPQKDALLWSKQLAEGLAKVHAKGLIHRDIKPENIYLDQTPLGTRAVLLDFGLARKEGEEAITEPGKVVGTVHYMSPEQISGAKVDGRTDIFGLGLIMYEMLTGRCVFYRTDKTGKFYFPGTLRAILSETPPAPFTLNKKISKSVSAIILKMLEKKQVDRYQSVEEVVQLLAGEEQNQPETNYLPMVVFVVVCILIGVIAYFISR